MRGRDGKVIVEDLVKLRATIEASSTVTVDGKAMLLAEVDRVRERSHLQKHRGANTCRTLCLASFTSVVRTMPID